MNRSTWNLNGRRYRAQQQVEGQAALGPDIVALQKFADHSLPELRTALAIWRFASRHEWSHGGNAV